MKFYLRYITALVFLLAAAYYIPSVATAHEVYVLDHNEISEGLSAPRSDFVQTVQNHLSQFIISGLVAVLLVLGVYGISHITFIEKTFDPFLYRMKRFAPHITQGTLGLALVSGGFFQAAFGPELPLSDIFGSAAGVFQYIYIILGACILFGIYPRIASTVTFFLLLPLIVVYKTYILNYGTYFGEALALALFGGGYALVKAKTPAFEKNIERHVHKYKFLLLRIAFGTSLLYASAYAKYIHGGLAILTVTRYHLTQYIPFDADFVVLGAFITELLIGLFFLIGFEIRFTSLLFLFFLTLSILFFGEAVWPHIILIGTSLAMFTHGYDRYTVVAKISQRKDLEPVL
ncbi:MAG: hypothetical protein HYR90_01665 [Candidatus Andersenbacteria bacterium]|nr:hypothetical protein [Candidatus Andersenbacteria bacterium]MBI3250867.1 hypothetical protein [Candidatus Andersenbacteria bacterium]